MASEASGEERVRLWRYLIVFGAIWVIVMTWRLYPQFKDTLKLDGRLMSYDDYLEESCGQRIGPAAAGCLEEARDTGRRLVASEQAKSVLLIVAPPLCYLVISLAAIPGWRARKMALDE